MFVQYEQEDLDTPRLWVAPNFPNATNHLSIFDSSSEISPNDVAYSDKQPWSIRKMFPDHGVTQPLHGVDVGYHTGLGKPTMTAMKSNSTVYQYLYPQQCRAYTSALVCAGCNNDIGTGEVPGVCVEQCENWFDACSEILARTNEEGHIVPCPELEVYKLHREASTYEQLYFSLDFSMNIAETFFEAMSSVREAKEDILAKVERDMDKNRTRTPDELAQELSKAVSNEAQMNPEQERTMLFLQEQARVFTTSQREARMRMTGGVDAEIIAMQGIYTGNATMTDTEGNVYAIDLLDDFSSSYQPSIVSSLRAMNNTLQELNITQAAMFYPNNALLSIPHQADQGTYLLNGESRIGKDGIICKPLKDILKGGVEFCEKMNVPIAHPINTFGLGTFVEAIEKGNENESIHTIKTSLSGKLNIPKKQRETHEMTAMPLKRLRGYNYSDFLPVPTQAVEDVNFGMYTLGRELFLHSIAEQTDINSPEWYKLTKQEYCAWVAPNVMVALSDKPLKMPEEMLMQQSLLEGMGSLQDTSGMSKKRFTYEEELKIEMMKKEQNAKEASLFDNDMRLSDGEQYVKPMPFGMWATKVDFEFSSDLNRSLLTAGWDEFPSVAKQRHAVLSYETVIKVKYDRLHNAKGWTWDQRVLYYIYHYGLAIGAQYMGDSMSRALSQVFVGLLNPMLHSDLDGQDPGVINLLTLRIPFYSVQGDSRWSILIMCTCIRVCVFLFLLLWWGTFGYIGYQLCYALYVRYLQRIPKEEGYLLENDEDGNKVGFDYDKYATSMGRNEELIKIRQERMKLLQERDGLTDNSHISSTQPVNNSIVTHDEDGNLSKHAIVHDVDFSSDDDEELTKDKKELRRRMGLYKDKGHVLGGEKLPSNPVVDKWVGMELSKQDKEDVKRMKEDLLKEYRETNKIADRPKLDDIKEWLDANRKNTKK